MAQEDVDAFRHAMDALNRGDVEAWVEKAHPDVVLEPLRGPISGAYRGHDGLREFFADTAESFESFRLSFPDVRDLGDGRLLAIGTLHFRARGSGIETDVPSAGIASGRDGLLLHWKDYGDPKRALEAAGLPE